MFTAYLCLWNIVLIIPGYGGACDTEPPDPAKDCSMTHETSAGAWPLQACIFSVK